MVDAVEELALLSLILLYEEERSTPFKQSLSLYARRMRTGKIRRRSLQPAANSSFSRLFASGQDDALITLCGFNHAAFTTLLTLFEPMFHQYSPFHVDEHGKF
jgi:hypothetical protein